MKRFIAFIAALLIPLNLAVAQQVSGGGGGGTPGGSNKQFQYNNSGAFAGSSVTTDELFTATGGSSGMFGNTLSLSDINGTSLGSVKVPGLLGIGGNSGTVNALFEFVNLNKIVWNAAANVGWGSQALNGGDASALRGSLDTSLARVVSGTLELNNGTLGTRTGTFIKWGGQSRVSTQFDKTDTTLANITGLTSTVTAGRTYSFQATLYCTCAAAGGAKVAVAGTATATAIRYRAKTFTGATINTHDQATALGSAVGASTTAVTVIEMDGTITVNAAGTLTIQFAENAASGTSSVLVGSFFIVQDMT